MGIALADCERKGFDDRAFRSSELLPFLHLIWSTPTNVIMWEPLDEFFEQIEILRLIVNLYRPFVVVDQIIYRNI